MGYKKTHMILAVTADKAKYIFICYTFPSIADQDSCRHFCECLKWLLHKKGMQSRQRHLHNLKNLRIVLDHNSV